MLFIQTLKRLLGTASEQDVEDLERERAALRKAWNLDEDDPFLVQPAEPHETNDPAGQSFDEHLWRGRLVNLCSEINKIGDDLPEQVQTLLGESRNLSIPAKVVFESAQAAFDSAIRQVVADRKVTDDEHQRLDDLRDALGLPDPMAAEMLEKIAAEAESVFKSRIQGL